MSGRLPPTGPRGSRRGRGVGRSQPPSQSGRRDESRGRVGEASRGDFGRSGGHQGSRGDQPSAALGGSPRGADSTRNRAGNTGFIPVDPSRGASSAPGAHAASVVPPTALVRGFLHNEPGSRSYYPALHFVDQADTVDAAGEGDNFARCFHCGRWKIEECKADDAWSCQGSCVYCKATSHNGKICPRLWCSASWWKRHINTLPPAAENNTLRPTEAELDAITAAGHTMLQHVWKPQTNQHKRKAEEALLEEMRVERVKRKLGKKQMESMAEEMARLREENARLKNGGDVQMSGETRSPASANASAQTSVPGRTLAQPGLAQSPMGARLVRVVGDLVRGRPSADRLVGEAHDLWMRLRRSHDDPAIVREARDFLGSLGVGSGSTAPTDGPMMEAVQLYRDLSGQGCTNDSAVDFAAVVARPLGGLHLTATANDAGRDQGYPSVKEESVEDSLPFLKEEERSPSPPPFVKKEEVE